MKKLKLYRTGWEYTMVLGLPTRNVELKEIKEEILQAKDLFNRYSLKSANKKEVIYCNVDEVNDVLQLTLISTERLPVAIRGLKLFTAKIVENIQKRDDGEELIEKIMRRRSFFKTISVIEKNRNNINKEEIEEGEKINILNNDIDVVDEVEENNNNLVELRKLKLREEIISLLIKSNISYEELEEIKEILKKEMI